MKGIIQIFIASLILGAVLAAIIVGTLTGLGVDMDDRGVVITYRALTVVMTGVCMFIGWLTKETS